MFTLRALSVDCLLKKKNVSKKTKTKQKKKVKVNQMFHSIYVFWVTLTLTLTLGCIWESMHLSQAVYVKVHYTSISTRGLSSSWSVWVIFITLSYFLLCCRHGYPFLLVLVLLSLPWCFTTRSYVEIRLLFPAPTSQNDSVNSVPLYVLFPLTFFQCFWPLNFAWLLRKSHLEILLQSDYLVGILLQMSFKWCVPGCYVTLI